jgi:cytochrome c-type biogenesis protein CcsB
MTKILKLLASPMLMAILIIAFAVASAIATFIENDFGTLAARALIYNSLWFEGIMFLLSINFITSIFVRKLYRKDKLAIMVFHVGFVVILFGAATTRYIGQEGMMHIREGQIATSFTSAEKYLNVMINGEEVFHNQKNFTPVSKNRFKRIFKVNDSSLSIKLVDYIPNAEEMVVEHFDGHPVIALVVVDTLGTKQVLVRPHKIIPVGISGIGFSQKDKTLDVEFAISDSGTIARSMFPITLRRMSMDEEVILSPGEWFKLTPQTFFSTNHLQFAYRGHWTSARIRMAYNPNPQVQGRDVLLFDFNYQGKNIEVFVPVSNADDSAIEEWVDGVKVELRYGTRKIGIPFGIKLNDFELKRYPGSSSPSSFTSNVEVLDLKGDVIKPFSIYMNNILNFQGYRFYQSSYDPDERGTYLSVNKDFWGTAITYLGYLILIIGIIWALFAPGSRFRKLVTRSLPVILMLFALFSFTPAQSQNAPIPDVKHSREFGKLIVQDQGGRMKPLGTLAGEVLRKLNRSNSFESQTPEQVYLGMSAFPDYWQHTPVIKIKNADLKAMLGVRGDLAAFVNFFDHQGGSKYRLSSLVQEAFAVKPSQRSALQKEIIKADEKVNVLYMVFSGQMARIFPVPNHPDDRWLSMAEASEGKAGDVGDVAKVYADYIVGVREASQTTQWGRVSSLLKSVSDYQYENGSSIVPSRGRVRAEILSNRILAFERLIPIYGLTGLLLLVLVFVELFRQSKFGNRAYMVLAVILLLGFLLHTFGIGLRWYIAGRAPLSNGFESMVYVAWAAMLAGFLFSKRSRVVLPATALLSTLTLFVAHLSWMDPEITNLVPVLKSYWLTIHVAVITSSYGFFGLGAILGLFNLVLYAFKSKSNRAKIDAQIANITVINELNLTLGLYLLTIGSFLGAIWANESWGRYWGWDPKETWALITMLVYAFVLHMRLIPSFKVSFAFNFGSLIGLGSVIMTYFGVNYYLSGLHSYAGGDPVPIPSWIYFVVAAIFSLSLFAWYNNRLVEVEGKN